MISFIYHRGKRMEFEAAELLRKLYLAPNEYVCTTGRVPTHLVLGQEEWAQFCGYVAWMRSTSNFGLTGVVMGATPSFCGMTLLRSAEETFVMAVELPEHMR